MTTGNRMVDDLAKALRAIKKNADGTATIPAENLTPTRGALIFGIVAATVLPLEAMHVLMQECSNFVTQGAAHRDCTEETCKVADARKPADATPTTREEEPA